MVATVRIPDAHGGRQAITETFGTMTPELLTLRDWLQAYGVTHVAMESTGVYWKPVYYVLEDAFTLLLVNMQQLKQVPGRKIGCEGQRVDRAVAGVGAAARQSGPPPPIRDLRDLTRYRKHQIRDRAQEVNRLHRVLEDAGIKLSTRGHRRDGGVGAGDAGGAGCRGPPTRRSWPTWRKGKLRKKLPALREALAGPLSGRITRF